MNSKPSQGPRTPAQTETAPREAPRFFRDPEAFTALAQTVIPQLFVDKGANDHVRVSVSGCATGEEAYALAILLREHMDTLDVVPHVRVFATDIDTQALAIARCGTYPIDIAEQMPPERLARFFVKQDHTYRVQKALRELCLFALHRLIKDPPFTRLDLISCQYMLMSLDSELQQKLMRLFHYALRPGGYLFLGTSEHLTEQDNLFRALDQQHRILQKIGPVSPVPVDFPFTNVCWPPPGPGEEAAHPRTAMPRQAEDVHKRAIEDEIEITQERLYITIAELETLNEELISANEEFQSTNEELEVSQAEFQAVNEELETMNAELHRKVEALDRANSDLKNLLDSTQIATIFLDTALCITSFTPAMQAILSFHPSDVGRPLANVSPRSANTDLVGDATDVLRTLVWLERSVRTTYTDTHYLIRLGPYRTVGDVIGGVVITFVDVTALQRAEEAARMAQVYAESIVATVRQPLLVLDAELRVHTANRAFYEVFQVTPAETEGRLLYALGNSQWDSPALRQLLGEILSQRQVVEDVAVEQDFPSIGRRTMLLSVHRLAGRSPDAALILLAIEDITIRQRAAQALQERTALLALQQDITRAANEAPRSAEALQYAVDRICAYMGWPVGHVYLAVANSPRWVPTSIWHLDTPEHFAAFQKATQIIEFAAGEGMIGRVGALGKPEWNVEVTTGPAGHRQQAALAAGLTAGVAVPLLVGHKVAGVLEFYASSPLASAPALLDALTQVGIQLGRAVERERAAVQAQRQQETLIQREKLAAMGSLLASVAHEMNNPLAIIMMQAELMRTDAASEPLAEYVETITQAASRCERLVHQFLTLARPHVPERSTVDLNALITRTMELLAPPLQVDTITVDLRLAADLPSLQADPHELQQVLVNLVTNAHQALRDTSPPRQVTLITRCNPTRTRVILEVADTGPGIPPEIQARIFEPFFTTKPPGVGTGLGLSLCHGIIAGHGGTLRVMSQLGHGTTFWVELPVGTIPESAPAHSGRADASSPISSNAILLVDDEPGMSRALAQLLRRDGHTVETVTNGRLALAMLQERAYDLILSDLRMPELDGPGLYRELAQQAPHLCRRFIVLTGDTLSSDALAFLSESGVPRLTKPFTVAQVRRIIQQTLRAG